MEVGHEGPELELLQVALFWCFVRGFFLWCGGGGGSQINKK